VGGVGKRKSRGKKKENVSEEKKGVWMRMMERSVKGNREEE